MERKKICRKGSLHLYNPKKEGLGTYDINYMNAYRKLNKKEMKESENFRERKAA